MAATEMLDVDWQGNNIINCIVNYKSVPPSPPFYSPQRQVKQEQITFDEKFVEPLEKPRRGRKRKQGNYQSADDNRPVQYKQSRREEDRRGGKTIISIGLIGMWRSKSDEEVGQER
ncbi:hypothetical protein SO802_019365 [Lithocarpus litseifolius]|uniref:Uncharacterized protein n=1 Tax=Lithocarpus litseifolius TaxID=425828 RepID=A0AAW2CNG4_9ROSI